jgi:membrane protein YdbS with pleckstrin-like domain
MARFFERRRPFGPRPAEAKELDRKVSVTPREWLGIHAVVFLILAWNFFAINLARTPGNWWFWIPIAALSVVLGGHAVWLTVRQRPALAGGTRSGVTRGADGR